MLKLMPKAVKTPSYKFLSLQITINQHQSVYSCLRILSGTIIYFKCTGYKHTCIFLMKSSDLVCTYMCVHGIDSCGKIKLLFINNDIVAGQ